MCSVRAAPSDSAHDRPENAVDLRQWQHAWIGTLITLSVATAYLALSALAIVTARPAGLPPRPR